MKLLRQCWDDDHAAILSSELILIMSIVVFGVIPGLIAVRNSTITALTTLSNVITVLTPQFTFSQITLPGGGTGYVLILNPSTATPVQVTGSAIAPTLTYNVIDPAP